MATGGRVATIRFDREGLQVHGGGGLEKEKEQLKNQKAARDNSSSNKIVGTLACVDER